MKKIFSVLMIMTLLLSLCACSASRPAAEPTTEPAAEATAVPTAEPTVEPTAEPTVEPTVEPAAQVDPALTEPLTAILTQIREGYFPGSAGSSLNGAAKAAALCDLFATVPAEAASVESVCADYLATLGDNASRAEFAQQVMGVRGSYISLRDFGAEVLETAGYTPTAAPWEYETMTPLFDALLQSVSIGFYADVLDRYKNALTGGMSHEDMIAADLNYMTVDSGLDGVGCTLRDLNGDGVPELLLCAMAEPEDAFLYALVFELYSVDMFGYPQRVFTSGERDRYYLAGETLFAHEGSGGAADSFADTEAFDGETMTIVGGETAERTVPELIALSDW